MYSQEQSLHSAGLSFLSETDLGELENISSISELRSDVPANILEIFKSLPELTSLTEPIWKRSAYLSYLDNTLQARSRDGRINPHKATIQYEMAKQAINEDTTRVVDSRDLNLVLGYTLRLLKEGRKEVWWSTADKDDISDPQGNTKYSPPLFKHITINNIDQKFDELQKYITDHPESMVKMFPQDGKNPSLCSLILVDDPGEKRLNFKIRERKYTTDERGVLEKPVEIEIDLNGETPIVILNNEQDNKWINILIKSKNLFEKLDKIELQGSSYLQPECMAYTDSEGNTTIKFFSDVIWGDKVAKTATDLPCPKFLPIIEGLKNAKIVYRQQTSVIEAIRDRRNLIYVFNYLNSNGNLKLLHEQLRQIEQGDPADNEMIIRLLAFALGTNFQLPEYARKVVRLYQGLVDLKNTHIELPHTGEDALAPPKLHAVSGFRSEYPVVIIPGNPKKRLNLLTQAERLTTKEMLLLIGNIKNGALKNMMIDQVNSSLAHLT